VLLLYIAAVFQLTIGYNPQERYVAYPCRSSWLGRSRWLGDRSRPASSGSLIAAAVLVGFVVVSSEYPLGFTDDAFHMVKSPASSNKRLASPPRPAAFRLDPRP
jgi:hypothetical protein